VRELITDLMTCIEKRKVDCRGALNSFDRTSIPVDAFAGMVYPSTDKSNCAAFLIK